MHGTCQKWEKSRNELELKEKLLMRRPWAAFETVEVVSIGIRRRIQIDANNKQGSVGRLRSRRNMLAVGIIGVGKKAERGGHPKDEIDLADSQSFYQPRKVGALKAQHLGRGGAVALGLNEGF